MQKISKNTKPARLSMISRSGGHTQKIAKDFLSKITKKKNKVACVVGLYGDLGTGKTTFTKYAAKALGIKQKLSSPTFVLMKRYPLRHEMFKNFYHLDAYRLKSEKELHSLGWKKIVKDPDNLVFIEWPENVKKAMPKKHYKVKIKHLTAQVGQKGSHRKFKIISQ